MGGGGLNRPNLSILMTNPGILLSFSKQRDTSLQQAGYTFSRDNYYYTNIDWLFKLKLHIEQKDKEYNDQSHSVCVRRVFLDGFMSKTKHVASTSYSAQ